LHPDDVVTALYQPYSFTALGAVGRNAEIDFEGTGLTLTQALGRIGGLRDDRADIKGYSFSGSKIRLNSIRLSLQVRV
jgi:polysaccharide export outer membrane protein